jgi:hypothetical protein
MNKQYCDYNGYPGTIQDDGSFDGGDTAAILGTLWFFGEAHDFTVPWDFDASLPVRHTDKSKWYGQPDRFSRDQLVAVLCGLLENNSSPFAIQKLFRRHRKRHFLTAWNTRRNGIMDAPEKTPDFTGPEVWALWLRIYKPWWMRIVLCFLDLETLASAVHWRWFRRDRVTRNHMLVSLASKKHSPTLVSRLANRINNWPDLIQRWEDHCRAVGEYPTAALFREFVKKP